MNDILVTALAWSALIIGIGGIASGIYGLIITKRENENRLKINEFTDVDWKDGGELKCENCLEPKPVKPMTCEKCGAPLKGCECEYCGTRYYIPNDEYETLLADNVSIMHVKKKLSELQLLQSQLQTLQDVEYRLRKD